MSGIPAPRRRDMMARSLAAAGGTAVAGAAGLSHPHAAMAVAAPRIHARSAWKARPPASPATIVARPDHLVVHHTAYPNSRDYSLKHAFQHSRDIQNLHMDHNHWSDTGQQLTISRGGHIMEGRNRTLQAVRQGKNVLGAQVANHNPHTLGIENEGTYISAVPPRKLWDSLVATLAWLCDVYGLNPHTAIVGHRDYNNTQCPGDALHARLPTLRNAVARRLGLARQAAVPPLVGSSLPVPRAKGELGPATGTRESRP